MKAKQSKNVPANEHSSKVGADYSIAQNQATASRNSTKQTLRK